MKKRPLIKTFVYKDEEMGAENGMVPFVASEEFKALNIALELDEGTSYDLPVSPVFYQDKAVWREYYCYFVTTILGSSQTVATDL